MTEWTRLVCPECGRTIEVPPETPEAWCGRCRRDLEPEGGKE